MHAAAESDSPVIFAGPSTAHFNNFQPCVLKEIVQVILNSPEKSYMLDSLPYPLFVKLHDCIPLLLHLSCHKSLQDDKLSDSERIAIITPIIKKSGLD